MATTGMTKLVLFALVMSHFAHSSAWRLVLVHSNDILFQLDEIRSDNSICYKPLPTPSTSTTIIPTTESTTTPTTESTTTPTTESTTTPTTESTTTPTTESTTAGTQTEPTTSQTESTPTTTTNEPTNATTTDSTIFSTTTDSSDWTSESSEPSSDETRFESEYSMFPGSTPSPKSYSVNVRNSESPIVEDFEMYQSKRIVRSATKRPSSIPSTFNQKSSTLLLPHYADKVNSTVPFYVDVVNYTVPYHANKVNSTAPYHSDVVNSVVPYHADKVDSAVPHHADIVNSTVPHHADVVNSTVPHHADIVNSTVPHHADVVNSTIPYHAYKVISKIPYHADMVNSAVPYFADVVNFVPYHSDETSTTFLHNSTPSSIFVTSTQIFPAKGDDDCYGGVARHFTKKEELKKGNENNTLYLNAGGMLGGNIWYPILGADPATVAFSFLKYDAVALGHRDFDEGLAVTIDYLKSLKNKGVKVLCANMDVSEEPAMKDLFEKSTIKKINGQNIGIVGFIGTDAEVIADTGKVKFLDEVESINSEIQKLFEQGVKFVIALGSADHRKAQDMLAKLYNVDVIVGGGGPDVFYYNGNRGPLGENVTGSYPVVASNQSKRLFVQTSRYGKYLGFLNIDINENGQIDSYDGNPVLLSSTTIPDPTLQGQVDDWERQVLTQSEEVIGSTKIPIITNRHICWYSECSGGNLMADAARWYLETKHQNSSNWENSVAAAVWHSGSMVHTALTDTIGKIKFGDILQMFPFANTLSTVKMNGQDVKKLMELSIENYNTSVKNLGEFLQVSGMRVEFNLSAPAGERVSQLIIRNTNSYHGDWSELDLNGRYKIVMPSFIARGGSRYSFLENLDSEDTEIRDEIALKNYIQWMSPLSYGKEERIRFITPTPTVECESHDTVGTVFLTIFLTLLVVGILFAGYKFLYPKIRDRSGSVLSLVR